MLNKQENIHFRSMSAGSNTYLSNYRSHDVWFEKGLHNVQVEYRAYGEFTNQHYSDWNKALLSVTYYQP